MPTLLDEKTRLAGEIRALAAKANDTGRPWTAEDEQTWTRVNADYDANEARLGVANSTEKRFEGNRMPGRQDQWGGDGRALPRGPLFRCAETGREIRALASDENVVDAREVAKLPNIGGLIADMVTGRNDHCDGEEMRAMIGSSDTAGGYLLTPQMSGTVVDLARSASVAMRAGAATLPMDSSQMTIARQTSDPTGYWRAEGQRITSSSVAFDRIVLRARTLAAIVPLSLELFEDAANIGQLVQNALSAQLGLKLDSAVLLGAGAANEPLGIKNTTGVNTIGTVATPNYADVTNAVKQILAANYPGEVSSLAWIANPRDWATYDGLLDTTNQPLQPPPWAAALRKLSTTGLPATEGSGSDSTMIVGDFSQCVVGMRTSGVRIEIFRDGSATNASSVTENALDQMLVFIRAYLRADVAVLRPTWFTTLTGVTA